MLGGEMDIRSAAFEQPSAPACVGVLRHTLIQFSILTCVSLGDIRNIVFYNIFYKFIYVSSFVKKCQINIFEKCQINIFEKCQKSANQISV